MPNRHKIWIVSVAVLLLCLWVQTDLWSQCPMCRMSAESNLKNGGTDGRGLNAGILYMLVLPYLLVGSIGLWWYRNRKRQAEDMDAPGDALLQD